jgi:hypothetical protein
MCVQRASNEAYQISAAISINGLDIADFGTFKISTKISERT